MNVQTLIEALSKIEDKSQKVWVQDENGNPFLLPKIVFLSNSNEVVLAENTLISKEEYKPKFIVYDES